MYQLPVLGAVTPGEKQDSLLELIGYVPDQRKALSKPQSKAQSNSKSKSRSSQPKRFNLPAFAPERIAPPAVQIQVDVQTEEKPAPYGLCRICGSPIGIAAARRAVAQAITIPGNDASLCSNPDRTCGSSGWVVNLNWFTPSERQGVNHE